MSKSGKKPIDVRKLAGSGATEIVAGQGYFPVLDQASADGDLYCVLRGGAAHFGNRGRVDLVVSRDGGKTFTAPKVVASSDWDDRNPALGVAPDGALVLAYWRYGSYEPDGSLNRSLYRYETCVVRSENKGESWSRSALDSAPYVTPSPYGRIVTLPGDPPTLLLPVYGPRLPKTWAGRETEFWTGFVRSTDGGRTFGESTIAAANYNEASYVLLPDRVLLGAFRTTGRDAAIHVARSKDGGRTFSEPRPVTEANEHPADLVVLSDGSVLLVYGHRREPYGVRARVSRDGGESWIDRTLVLADDGSTIDCGYPSVVRRKDGTILVAYYSSPDTADVQNGVIKGAWAKLLRFDERALLAAIDR